MSRIRIGLNERSKVTWASLFAATWLPEAMLCWLCNKERVIVGGVLLAGMWGFDVERCSLAFCCADCSKGKRRRALREKLNQLFNPRNDEMDYERREHRKAATWV